VLTAVLVSKAAAELFARNRPPFASVGTVTGESVALVADIVVKYVLETVVEVHPRVLLPLPPAVYVPMDGTVRLDKEIASVTAEHASTTVDEDVSHNVTGTSMTVCSDPGQLATAAPQDVIVSVLVVQTVDTAVGASVAFHRFLL
jgi:phosphoribosylformylglycinamidine (FGAM) synthase-like enzyme